MKVWRLTDEAGNEVAAVPVSDLLDPAACAEGRSGYGIYEAFDASGHLIYTGRTSNLANRLQSHSTQSPWWGFASEVRWTPVENYGEAVGLERIGIAADQGDWNIASRRELDATGRQQVPAAMHARLSALYAAASSTGRSADLDNYICTARTLGWTLQAIANVLSITREAVRLRSIKGTVDYDLFIPPPPRRVRYERKVWPVLLESTRREMEDLQRRACLVRGLTPLDHPNRQASERLSELIAEAKLRGVREREIAEAVGVTIGAIRMRLKRHGYMNNPPSQSTYNPGSGQESRKARVIGASCERHHPGLPSDFRLINGDPARPVCRECERFHAANYRARRAEGSAA